jgi:8-oxo-dGTP diphosphatase
MGVQGSKGPEHGDADGGLRRWHVAGGIIEAEGRVLLVENLRRNGTTDWSPPGGVVEAGEDSVDGLTREVLEETGLVVEKWHGPIYSVETVAIDMGWHLSVKVFRAIEWKGNVSVGADPDGIVTDARFLDSAGCNEKMAANGLWVREPLMAWLHEKWSDHRAFRYLLEGNNRATMTVTRQ